MKKLFILLSVPFVLSSFFVSAQSQEQSKKQFKGFSETMELRWGGTLNGNPAYNTMDYILGAGHNFNKTLYLGGLMGYGGTFSSPNGVRTWGVAGMNLGLDFRVNMLRFDWDGPSCIQLTTSAGSTFWGDKELRHFYGDAGLRWNEEKKGWRPFLGGGVRYCSFYTGGVDNRCMWYVCTGFRFNK